MTLTISTADWTPAIDWLSKAPGSVGLRLSEAIAAFVLAVMRTPATVAFS